MNKLQNSALQCLDFIMDDLYKAALMHYSSNFKIASIPKAILTDIVRLLFSSEIGIKTDVVRRLVLILCVARILTLPLAISTAPGYVTGFLLLAFIYGILYCVCAFSYNSLILLAGIGSAQYVYLSQFMAIEWIGLLCGGLILFRYFFEIFQSPKG